MLILVKTESKKLKKYQNLISEKLFIQVKRLAKELKGLKVFHVNSTPRGGGVAEVLKGLVPLMKGIGLEAEWYTISAQEDFFRITKRLHNALQGKDFSFPESQQRKYQRYIKSTARFLKNMKTDVWVIHDPQPVGIIDYLPSSSSLISRVHIDTTNSDLEAWEFVSGFLEKYDKIIFSSKSFVQPNIAEEKTIIFSPAIDPLALKNQSLGLVKAESILKNFNIDPSKPLIAQISRFDTWKDPLGVIKAFRLARKKIPNLQLVLVGFFLAQDDPEAREVYQIAEKRTEKEDDIHLFANCEVLGSLRVDTFVSAVQIVSDVVLQKSIREGFGLTVAEAMWKEKPVIGGNVGGIKLQIENGQNGFLVSSPRQAADRIVELINNPRLAKKIGKKAKTTVRNNFLIPRLVKDYLELFRRVV